MFKIVILGCENSHCNTFLDFIRGDEEFSDLEVVGVYSDDADAAARIAEIYGVYVMSAYDEMAGKVDGVMVTARYGTKHLEFLKPYLPYDVAVFVDKPVTVSETEAEEMMKLFKKYGTRFSGGSVLKYCDEIKKLKKDVSAAGKETVLGGVVRAPIIRNSPYCGVHFYGPHLIEMVCEIFGHFPNSVSAIENENCITATLRYAFYDITAVYTSSKVSSCYYAMWMDKDSCYGEEVVIDKRHFKEEFLRFYQSLKKEIENPDAKEFISPVYILKALEKAQKSGKEEKIVY